MKPFAANRRMHIHTRTRPRPLKRHRTTRAGHRYDPSAKEKRAWLKEVTLPAVPLKGALAVACTFTFSRPKAHFRTGKYAGELKQTAPALMVTTPDVDNVAKFYLDALNGKAFLDDRQIVRMEANKRYGEEDSVTIRLMEIEE